MLADPVHVQRRQRDPNQGNDEHFGKHIPSGRAASSRRLETYLETGLHAPNKDISVDERSSPSG